MSYSEPRYLDVTGEISATFRPANQGPDVTIGQQTAMRYLATGESTHGQFGLYRWDAEPRTPRPNAHFHDVGIVFYSVRHLAALQRSAVDRFKGRRFFVCP